MAAGEVLQASTIIRQQSATDPDVSTSSGHVVVPTDSGPGIATTAASSSQSDGTRHVAQYVVACGAFVATFIFAFVLA